MTSTSHRLGLFSLSTRFLRYARRRQLGLLAVLATMLVKVGLDVLKPWPMKVLVDHVLKPESNKAGADDPAMRLIAMLPGASTGDGLLLWCIAGTVLLFLLVWALSLATSYANIAFGQRMFYDLAADLFGHLQRLSLRFHSRKPAGDLIRRVTSDASCVATIVQGALLPVIASVVSLVTMFTIMFRMDPLLTLLSLAVVPLMIFTFRRYSNRMLDFDYRKQETEGRMYDIVEQTLSAMPVVQAYGAEERAERRFRNTTSETLAATLAATDVQLRFKILIGLATALGTAAILWIGARHVLDGTLTVGSILIFISYLGSLYGPLESLMYTSSTIQGAGGSATRVMEILEAEPEVSDRSDAVELPPAQGHVLFNDVSFGYDSSREVLHNISLEARPGQTIAIVGATGAGKSTLVSLIARFYDPWHGSISIDGNDLRTVRLQSLRRQVAIVLQEPFLFPLTIAENISYGRPDATQQQIEAAARAANAHGFIERLPEGYQTVIGERGATLSGGERQRLSIARALLKDAPVLILDEPTSALDAETEGLLLEALKNLMRGRTTFIIAHRLSTIRDADRIVVLRDGQIAETGTHEELIRLGGLYSSLHAIQFREPVPA